MIIIDTCYAETRVMTLGTNCNNVSHTWWRAKCVRKHTLVVVPVGKAGRSERFYMSIIVTTTTDDAAVKQKKSIIAHFDNKKFYVWSIGFRILIFNFNERLFASYYKHCSSNG